MTANDARYLVAIELIEACAPVEVRSAAEDLATAIILTCPADSPERREVLRLVVEAVRRARNLSSTATTPGVAWAPLEHGYGAALGDLRAVVLRPADEHDSWAWAVRRKGSEEDLARSDFDCSTEEQAKRQAEAALVVRAQGYV